MYLRIFHCFLLKFEFSASLLNNVNLGSRIQLIFCLKSLKHKWYPESESSNESFEGRILTFRSFAFQKGASLLTPVTGFYEILFETLADLHEHVIKKMDIVL